MERFGHEDRARDREVVFAGDQGGAGQIGRGTDAFEDRREGDERPTTTSLVLVGWTLTRRKLLESNEKVKVAYTSTYGKLYWQAALGVTPTD